MRKTPWIALLLPCALFLGLILGMLVGSLIVPDDAGLAAGASILFYGLIGLVVGAVITIALARRLAASALRATAITALVLSVLGAAAVGYRIMETQREMKARSRIAAPGAPRPATAEVPR
jgi:hypothetical protein